MKKVIIAENSAILKNYLKDILESSGQFEIIKMTANGEEVLRTNEAEDVNLIILGEGISLINEVETTRYIMDTKPVPVVILSNDQAAPILAEALNYGSFNMIRKPDFSKLQEEDYIKQLVELFIEASNSRPNTENIISTLKDKYKDVKSNSDVELVPLIVIGASTGGPQTLQHIFNEMPADFPIGIALVQHFESGFEEGFASWLNNSSGLNIRIAQEKDFPKPGEVIIAPQQAHMRTEGANLVLRDGPKVNNQKPAVDVLFSSTAPIYREKLLGVLLTGMGRDGAQGCLDIVKNGGFTVVQDKESSIVYGMPKEATILNAASVILPYQKISSYLAKAAEKLLRGEKP